MKVTSLCVCFFPFKFKSGMCDLLFSLYINIEIGRDGC